MSNGTVVQSLKELIGGRVVCIRQDGGGSVVAECVGIDGPMIKLRGDAGVSGWFSLVSFYCVRKVGPNEDEMRALKAIGLTAEDFQPGAFGD